LTYMEMRLDETQCVREIMSKHLREPESALLKLILIKPKVWANLTVKRGLHTFYFTITSQVSSSQSSHKNGKSRLKFSGGFCNFYSVLSRAF
jgi:hypothetical protein